MCGIVGCVGKRNVIPVLLESLKKLEYRGYDSAGIATLRDTEIDVTKTKGKISELETILDIKVDCSIGIGHTRWATHGTPSSTNAHPHTDCNGNLAVVHNGIIENFQSLKEELIRDGHIFNSDTDTEVFAHLVEEHYEGDLTTAVKESLSHVRGSYAVAVISDYEPDTIVAARKDSPMVVGLGENENFIASDVPAILKFTNRIIYVNDGEVVTLKGTSVDISTLSGAKVPCKEITINWDIEDSERAGYEHYMLKEIHEQPRSVRETMEDRLLEFEAIVNFKEIESLEKKVRNLNGITILACGTSYHAGLIGKYVLEDMLRIPVRVEYSSEFRYNNSLSGKNSLAICISQSGETADTLAALEEAKSQGFKTLAITNVPGSSITRKADEVVFTRSGIEIGVAATKTFTSQILTLFMLGLYLARIRNFYSTTTTINFDTSRQMITSLKYLPVLMESLLDDISDIEKCSLKISEADSCYFIGRGVNYPLALEGALKMKEISYVKAEGFPAGELKHGPLALITEGTPIIAIAPKGLNYSKILSNIKEVKARNAYVIAIASDSDNEIAKYVDFVLRIPNVEETFSTMLSAVVLQLLAYYVAKNKGADIDQPRNLAKSVTVE